jgi:gamma-glutamyltranspeptidase/glutathione hydrolase
VITEEGSRTATRSPSGDSASAKDSLQAPTVAIEGHAPDDWMPGLSDRGHKVEARPAYDGGFGHAHAIVIDHDGFRAGAADPRTMVGTAAGI